MSGVAALPVSRVLRDLWAQRSGRIGMVIVVSTPPGRNRLAAKHINDASDADLIEAARGVVPGGAGQPVQAQGQGGLQEEVRRQGGHGALEVP